MSAIILLILRILLAGILYAFFGFMLYTLWRDLKSQSRLLISRQPPPVTLTTLPDSPPLTRHYTCAEVIMGREPACDFPIDDQTVSSKHARLSYHQSQWWLEDMASTNGTLLNNEKITSPVVITHGDELRMGQVGVKITIGPAEVSNPRLE